MEYYRQNPIEKTSKKGAFESSICSCHVYIIYIMAVFKLLIKVFL